MSRDDVKVAYRLGKAVVWVRVPVSAPVLSTASLMAEPGACTSQACVRFVRGAPIFYGKNTDESLVWPANFERCWRSGSVEPCQGSGAGPTPARRSSFVPEANALQVVRRRVRPVSG